MQEQEVIINQEPAETISRNAAQPAQEIEFLENYEIKNWEFSPRMYKILLASAAFNILALVVFAQTNILQSRACDSPWVGRVCQVIDTVYLGSTILSSDKEFASLPYERTEIEDAEIVWINQTGNDPLTYPEGYFALANPEAQVQTVMQDPTLATSGFENFQNYTPPPSSNFPAPTPVIPPGTNLPPQKLPPPASTQINIPDSAEVVNNPNAKNTRKGNKPVKSENNKPDANNTAKNDEKKEEPKQLGLDKLPVADEVINKKPLQDFGDEVLDKVSKKEVDLTKPFSVVMVGTITQDGKFDRDKSRYMKADGDQPMIDIAKRAIESIGESGLLTYLKSQNVDMIKFELVQDDKQIYAIITSIHPTKEKASSVSSALNTAIGLGKLTVKEEDTLALLNAATVESKDKLFILNFKLDKVLAHELITRQLQKAEAKRKELQQQQQPNSTAQTANSNKETGK